MVVNYENYAQFLNLFQQLTFGFMAYKIMSVRDVLHT